MIRTAIILIAAAVLAGCGGGSSSSKNTVVQVTLNPGTLSMVAGQVAGTSVSAQNSTNTAIASTFTYNTSNPKLVTVSPAGLVCAGVWDSTFVVCNGNDASGNQVSGIATITATAAGVTSAPVTISVHPTVTSIVLTKVPPVSTPPAPPACLSNGQTFQFEAQAFHNATDITSQIGQFSWLTTDATVVTVDSNGMATARGPGAAHIIASVGNVSSGATSPNFLTCLPVRIILHVSGDPAGQPTETATLNLNETKVIQADMIDSNGVPVLGAPVTVISNNPAVATVGGPTGSTTLTGVSPGGAGILAVCAPPTCGNGIVQPVYSDLFSVTVNGTSPATTVYVGSSAIPAAGTSPVLIPIDTSKTPPAAGTAITLPGAPISMKFVPNGTRAFVTTTSGLISLDTIANTITLLASDPVGKILAVSPDGSKVIVSNVIFNANVSFQRLWVFDQAAGTLATFILPGAVTAAFDHDGFRAYIGADNGNVYIYSPFQTERTLTLTGAFTDAAPLASGPFTFLANSNGLNVISTCDNAVLPNAPTTLTPLLLGEVKNANQIIAANTSGFEVITVTIPDDTGGQCHPPTTFANQAIDFGLGPLNPRQLITASNGAHIVELAAGQPRVLVGIPGAGPGVIPLAAGGTEAVAGDMTLDGETLWVGVAGTNSVHRINLANSTDDFQISLNLNGTNAIPDIVGVRPK
ncbi:MAG TPA: Ig-like domain-containing protein [Candidatus Angelobacter sp.]|nr:Ig-like domain-containing protein [Candidatus Angelobacter sp.]